MDDKASNLDIDTPVLQGRFTNLGDALWAAGQQYGDQLAFIDGDTKLTYAEWAQAAEKFASWLSSRGIAPGDIVAIILPSSIDYAISCSGAIRQGCIATGINLRLGSREVASILSRARVKAIVIEDDYQLPKLDYQPVVLRRSELAQVCNNPGAEDYRPPQIQSSDPACIVWTSGTTGLPKGACFDHDNLEAAVGTSGIMAAPHDRCLIPLPFAHAGYMVKQWQQIAYAITYVLMPPIWSAEEMLRLIQSEEITVGFGVPTQWQKFLRLPDLDKVDFSRLRVCTTSTAPAPPELIEEVTRRLGCPMIVRYAMTESPSISGTSVGDSPEVLYRTVGKPQQGLELKLIDEGGHAVEPGTVGRICVRGATVMRGYWGDPEQTAKAITADGWLLSSDLGYINKEGNLVLAGRMSDMYIRGGYNIYPIEVEHILSEHPEVVEASVVGVEAPVIGEIGVAFVVPAHPNSPPSVEELRAWCRAQLADYKTPDAIEFIASMPVNSMLKVNKGELKTMAKEKYPIKK